MKLFLAIFFSSSFCAFAQDWETLNKEVQDTYKQGHFKKSVLLGKMALAEAEKEFGQKHDNYSRSLYNLAICLNKLGEYSESEKLITKSLSIIEQLHGRNNVDYLSTEQVLGNIHFYREEFDQAETVLLRVKNAALLLYNKNDAYAKENSSLLIYHFSNVQNTLGQLYRTLGQYEKAEACYQEIVEVMKYTFGDYASEIDIYRSALNNLANVLDHQEKYDKAETLYKEILDIQAKATGKKSREYVTYQNNLASLYKHTQQWSKADSLWKCAMDTLASLSGKDDPLYISMLSNMSDLYFEQEKYVESEKCCLEAKQLQEENFGKDNAMYQIIVFNLAHTYQFMHRFEEADKLYQIAISKMLRDIEKNFAYLTEDAKRAFYQENKLYTDEFLMFALQKSGIIPLPNLPQKELSKKSLGDIYNMQLATKAIVLNATTKMRERILGSKDTNLIKCYQSWEEVKNQIAQANATNRKESNGRHTKLDSLSQVADALEKDLARGSSSFRKGFQNPQERWQDVRKKLKPGEAAVELVKFYNGVVYLALIITPETKKYPEAVLIKSSKDKDLEKQFLSYYKNCIRYEMQDTGSYNRFWKPVYVQLQKTTKGKIKKVYLSPDGMFNQINLNTLQNPQTGNYVLDEVDIHLLTNTKELVERAPTAFTKSPKAMLFGRPSYKFALDDMIKTPQSEKERTRSAQGVEYPDLEATEKEVTDIQNLLEGKHWQTTLFVGGEATEENVKKCQNPTVLHVATHGFFLPSEDKSLNATLQSGLVFAGVNGSQRFIVGDGVLTAYEAMNLDLDSTELVVLSACETGLGEVETGEGVYGFQRTLKVGGAKSILMSLWQVNDQATQELMKEFYSQWLLLGNKRAAFRKAQDLLKLKYKAPKYWGAFVMVGE